MKVMLTLLTLFVSVFVFGCDDMQKPVMDVIGDVVEPTVEAEPTVEPTVDAEMPEETVESDIPVITFENVLDLAPGRYRLQPTDVTERHITIHESVIGDIHWGNVDRHAMLADRDYFPADAPKIFFELRNFDQYYYFHTIDGDPVIGHTVVDGHPLYDEIVIEITGDPAIGDYMGGERGNKFPYKYIAYEGIPIENLTNPDKEFEQHE